MMKQKTNCGSAQRGVVLVTSLLLLLVVTIMAISMFKSFGIQERIAGNLREKQRALHAAETAQQQAELWLSANWATAPTVCNSLLDGNLNQGQICSNLLTNITTTPWGPTVGVTYKPPSMNVTAASAATPNTYTAIPRFYISDLGVSAGGQGEVYQIDAVGFGANANAVAVVESTYLISPGVIDRGGL
jgi:type IV pilus assembly protein PilX